MSFFSKNLAKPTILWYHGRIGIHQKPKGRFKHMEKKPLSRHNLMLFTLLLPVV